MRRVRPVREHRDSIVSAHERRRKERQKRLSLARRKISIPVPVVKEDKKPKSQTITTKPFQFGGFIPFDNYVCQLTQKVKVCHVIDSMGLGGGQTMMMELVKSLDKYYGEHVLNRVVYLGQQPAKLSEFFLSYGVAPIHVRPKELKQFLESQDIDVVIQHRLMNSVCLKNQLPTKTKYILLNHTFHCLDKLRKFTFCDIYVSVCEFLNRKTPWDNEDIHKTRRFIILNGVERDYLDDIPAKQLSGSFKTGRCHRLVNSKFNADSLLWMEKEVSKHLPGHVHHLIGNSKEAKVAAKKNTSCIYYGAITNRQEKMSILKALDLYFYETFHSEGASIAVLESLSCGVPVICKPLGGNTELVINGVNGYIVRDRSGFLQRMKELCKDKNLLQVMRQNTLKDFDERLHIRHTACKYVQLMERLVLDN